MEIVKKNKEKRSQERGKRKIQETENEKKERAKEKRTKNYILQERIIKNLKTKEDETNIKINKQIMRNKKCS